VLAVAPRMRVRLAGPARRLRLAVVTRTEVVGLAAAPAPTAACGSAELGSGIGELLEPIGDLLVWKQVNGK